MPATRTLLIDRRGLFIAAAEVERLERPRLGEHSLPSASARI